jgi:branched-subunit amino acid transport protein
VSAVWTTVILLGALTVLLKSAGPLLVGGRELPPVVLRVMSLLAPALLAAFVAVSVFGGDRQLVLDARAIGLGAAAVALLLRAPIIVVVLAAALATALVRAF